ncbi:TetR/AcrR family transcriptional regulator [Lentilactobacillus sp. SPB1-3]|uniref:TetR/AcrR family transcriptional regulator n=1 Tax=Lentilactobacillus terminaliae TaxID=3003483 RepID=A0ACD5DEV9_9LACO|nr:TetR/AcrR family transcriptional regulator [Lentilactobacillus sp. SPB1-3]MCZ0977465.1 TetR/AcrR family transcriptional regulator [Lentilactobacillus sp. SPB1-3]
MNDNDKRVQRTKIKIRNALFKLLDRQTIDKITVKSIIDEAGLNRTTFYSYYTDKYDLLEKVQENTIKQIIQIKHDYPVTGGDSLGDTHQLVKTYFSALFKFVQDHHQEVKLLLINSSKITVLRNMTNQNPEFYEHWRPVIIRIRGVAPEHSYAALVGVVINFYFDFEDHDYKTDPEKIASVLADIVTRYMQ